VTTSRLRLRPLQELDAEFILELLNDPSFIANIGDKEVRTLDDALGYIETGRTNFGKRGFGLLAVEPLVGGEVMGICGLVRRENLEGPDLGYAFLPRYWGKGYASEAARAILESCGFDRILAVTDPANTASIGLLQRLGFEARGRVKLGEDRDASNLYVWTRPV
jgi:RimJ/RimL family protein N-acetyltransferase